MNLFSYLREREHALEWGEVSRVGGEGQADW